MNAIIVLTLCAIAGASAQYNYGIHGVKIPDNYNYGYNHYVNSQQQQQHQQLQHQQHNMNQQYKPVVAIPDSRCPRTDDPMRPVHLPFSGNCAKFMKCTGGMGFVMDCPAGLEYSQRSDRCDYPNEAQCSMK